MEIGCPYFSSKLFTETNILTFKQFISVSYKMFRMDLTENYALGLAYYNYMIDSTDISNIPNTFLLIIVVNRVQ